MGLKDAFLQKGWAGYTISRQETVERLNPLLEKHIPVNRMYDAVIEHLGDSDYADQLRQQQRIARMNVGKLAETVFSSGGVAYNGTDLDPATFDAGNDEAGMLHRLHDLETDLLEALDAESDIEHQMRTRAVLDAVRTGTQERINLLETETRRRPRPAGV